jgi:hypothetical protein
VGIGVALGQNRQVDLIQHMSPDVSWGSGHGLSGSDDGSKDWRHDHGYSDLGFDHDSKNRGKNHGKDFDPKSGFTGATPTRP